MLWPLVTVTSQPNVSGDVVSTDSRGHRITRVGDATVRSDDAPSDAAFLLGSSYAFGVGASSDGGTLAAALTRQTGVPYVNLAVRRASSTQELVAALPFAERSTSFVVCSGLNNVARTARSGAGTDPLFGPLFDDPYLRQLRSHSVREISALVKSPVRVVPTRALAWELRGRLWARAKRQLGLARPAGRSFSARGSEAEKTRRARAPRVGDAANRQLRDLRALRQIVPDDASVIFALQPFAPVVRKQWETQELELFSILDEAQGGVWHKLRDGVQSHWDEYATLLEQGCRELAVPFVDLSKAEYTGWCFVDRVHATDRGYAAAASLLAPALPASTRVVPDSALTSALVGPSPGGETIAHGEDLALEPLEGDEDANVYPLW